MTDYQRKDIDPAMRSGLYQPQTFVAIQRQVSEVLKSGGQLQDSTQQSNIGFRIPPPIMENLKNVSKLQAEARPQENKKDMSSEWLMQEFLRSRSSCILRRPSPRSSKARNLQNYGPVPVTVDDMESMESLRPLQPSELIEPRQRGKGSPPRIR